VDVLTAPTPYQIQAFRRVRKLTQQQLAELLYLSCRQIQRWESGEKRMGLAYWELLHFKLPLDKPLTLA
jgi:DNA-binding transcriptional regulator YiaG